MERYKIFCTESQTKKAFELGAPLSNFITEEESRKLITIAKSKNEIKEYEEELNKYHQTIIGDRVYYIPTAEQMIYWLEEQGITIDNVKCYTGWCARAYTDDDVNLNKGRFFSRKEATLAAIDAALDYLIDKK